MTNWYKESQFYEDIDREEYDDDDYGHHTFVADQYFSIGQNEETIKDSYCWVMLDGKLLARKGGTHSMNFIHIMDRMGLGMDDVWRGWYDPIQQLVSIVVPHDKDDGLFTNDRIPSILMRQLRQEFGNDFEVKIF